MSSNPGRAPEPFSLSPLLSLLPSLGNAAHLEALVSSLFARREAVEAARRGLAHENEAHRSAESAMLRQILDWLSAQRDEGGADE